MELSPEQARRLGDAVASQRAHLDLSQEELAPRARLSVSTIRRIEKARQLSIADRTLAALDRGLEWGEGSAASVAQGGDPIPKGAPQLAERTWRDSRGRVWRELADRSATLSPEDERTITDVVSRLLDGHGA